MVRAMMAPAIPKIRVSNAAMIMWSLQKVQIHSNGIKLPVQAINSLKQTTSEQVRYCSEC